MDTEQLPDAGAPLDTDTLRTLLTAVAAGEIPTEEALRRLTARAGPPAAGAGWVDLGFARVDTARATRTGDPEVVFAAGKSPAQTRAIVAALREAHPRRPTLITRADPATVRALHDAWPDAATTLPGASGAPGGAADLAAGDPAWRGGPWGGARRWATVVVGPWPRPRGRVLVVTGGTSDGQVAEEAAITARASGTAVECLQDVGVAGIHRLLDRREALAAADCLVVVAGMEGALPSVVGGLVGTPVVAVPTSVGYGASFGGLAALLAMLNSCAPGVVVCNIDNGFGAGLFAARVARRTAAAPSGDPGGPG